MTILASVVTDGGLTLAHTIVKAEFLQTGMIRCQVNHHENHDALKASRKVLWQTYPEIDARKVADAGDFTLLGIERALVLDMGSILYNGVVVDDSAEPTLDDLKAAKWEEIKAARDAEETGGYPNPTFGRFDSDLVSVTRLATAATAGASVVWTLQDNTSVSLTPEDMGTVLRGLVIWADGLHAKARDLRAAIAEAETPVQVQAIAWAPVQVAEHEVEDADLDTEGDK